MDYMTEGSYYARQTYLDPSGNAITFDSGTNLVFGLIRNGVFCDGTGSTTDTRQNAAAVGSYVGEWSATLTIPSGWTNGTDIIQAGARYTLNGNAYEEPIGPAFRLDGTVNANVAFIANTAVTLAGSSDYVTFCTDGAVVTTATQCAGLNDGGASLTTIGDARIGHLNADVSTRLAASAYVAPDNSDIATILADVVGSLSTLLSAIKAKTDNLPAAPAAATDVAVAWTTTMTEAYAAVGSPMTPAEALYMIYSVCAQFAVSGTTIATKKIDGSTTAMTFTIDSSTAPTERTRTG